MSRVILADVYGALPEWKQTEALRWLQDGVVFDDNKGLIAKDVQRLRPGSDVRREWEIYKRALGSVASTANWKHLFAPSCLDWARYERSHSLREITDLKEATKTLRSLPQEPWILTEALASALDRIDHVASVRCTLGLGWRTMVRRSEEADALARSLTQRGDRLLSELLIHIEEITAPCGVLTDADYIRAWGLLLRDPALAHARAKLYTLGGMLSAVLPAKWERVQDLLLQLHLNKAAAFSQASVPAAPELAGDGKAPAPQRAGEGKEIKQPAAPPPRHVPRPGEDVPDLLFGLIRMVLEEAKHHVQETRTRLTLASNAVYGDMVRALACNRVENAAVEAMQPLDSGHLARLAEETSKRVVAKGGAACFIPDNCRKKSCLLAQIVTHKRLLERL